MLLNKPGFLRDKPFLFLFLVSMAGGIVWGALMYLFMGLVAGYDVQDIPIYLIGGLAFGLLFFLAMFVLFGGYALNERWSRKKLERVRDSFQPYEHAFFGTIRDEDQFYPASVIFILNRVVVTFVRRRRVHVLEIYYCDVDSAFLLGPLFHLAQGDQRLGVLLEISPEEQEALSQFLVEYKVDKEICFATKGKLFFAEETTDDMHWRFRFLRKDGDGMPKPVQEDALSVHVRDIDLLSVEYASCFDPTSNPFQYEGPWTASSEETEQILAKVKELRPVGCDDLIPWLERAVAEYDGIVYCYNTNEMRQ